MVRRQLGFHPVVVGPGTKTGMPIHYDNPKEVGADRIANAVAAYDLYGGPTVVVDFGTGNPSSHESAKCRLLRAGGCGLAGCGVCCGVGFSAGVVFR